MGGLREFIEFLAQHLYCTLIYHCSFCNQPSEGSLMQSPYPVCLWNSSLLGPSLPTVITDPPAELLVGVCLRVQAPSTVAKGVLEARGQGCSPSSHDHSCYRAPLFVLQAWRAGALWRRVQMSQGLPQAADKVYLQVLQQRVVLTGKALLGQEIQGEHPPWQGQRK